MVKPATILKHSGAIGWIIAVQFILVAMVAAGHTAGPAQYMSLVNGITWLGALVDGILVTAALWAGGAKLRAQGRRLWSYFSYVVAAGMAALTAVVIALPFMHLTDPPLLLNPFGLNPFGAVSAGKLLARSV
jgi:hypothetical protein